MPGKPPTYRDRIDPRVDYATALSGRIPDYLHYVERQTHLKTIAPQMMSDRLQGRVLALLSKLVQPRRILELGTFTGYATLCLAEGLTPDGHLDTIEGDPELAHLARTHLLASPYADRITLHEREVAAVLPQLTGAYDIIFLDADKRAYPEYLPRLLTLLAPGGLLVADNVLWDGRAGKKIRDADADALRRYNELVYKNQQLDPLVLPIRDGLSIARRTTANTRPV